MRYSVFSVNELIERLHEIFGDEFGQVTKRDIQEPTPDFVNRVVFNFLQEFGVSEQMLAPNHACLDLHSNLSSDITDTLPLLYILMDRASLSSQLLYP